MLHSNPEQVLNVFTLEKWQNYLKCFIFLFIFIWNKGFVQLYMLSSMTGFPSRSCFWQNDNFDKIILKDFWVCKMQKHEMEALLNAGGKNESQFWSESIKPVERHSALSL